MNMIVVGGIHTQDLPSANFCRENNGAVWLSFSNFATKFNRFT